MSTVSFLLALVLAAVMGFAVQRGATCTVAAVDEVLSKRRAQRLLAMLEASLWVLGGLLLAQALGGHMNLMPVGYAVSVSMLVGAVLLGLGAAINRACVFGAIARLGSGDWSYSLTPVGFYVGCVLARKLELGGSTPRLTMPAAVLQSPMILLGLIAVLVLLRIVWILQSLQIKELLPSIFRQLWAPHAATLVIGLTFIGLLYLVGPWTYTEVLAEWSTSGVMQDVSRGLLLLALLAGAILGGWSAGRFMPVWFTTASSIRCFGGGLFMGVGSLLIPGGNDGLILIGMPLLLPYAWLAFGTMFVTIAVFLKGQEVLRSG
jgi:hypothetical protein